MHANSGGVSAAEFSKDLAGTYNITPWLFVVPVLTAILIIKKVSAIATLFIAAVIAGVAALFFQPQILMSIAGGNAVDASASLDFMSGFKGLLISYY